MPRRGLVVAILLSLLAVLVVVRGSTARWDLPITLWLQHAAPVPDFPSAILVFLGNAEVVIPAIALASLPLLWRDRARGAKGLWLAAVLVGLSVLAVALKHFVVHPGPPDSLQRHVLRFGLGLPTPYSFPSGHTIRATVIAGTLLRRTPVLAIVAVLCMMAGLVYLGDHWTSDVLGGLCFGWVCVELLHAAKIA